MLRFRSFIQEARRNANHPAQRKLNALEILEKYKDDPDVHISYTKINKIGINPKSEFPDTPIGVYTYPLKQVWNDLKSEGVANVPFAASDSKYIFILKERSKPLVDVSDYSKSNLRKDLKKISLMIEKENYDKSMAKAESLTGETVKTTKRNFAFLRMFLYYASNRHTSAPFMTKILNELGYSGFSDRSGRGEIHPGEPIQSFFMSSRYYKVLESIDLKSLDFKDMDRREKAKFIKKNASKMTDDELIDHIRDDVELLKYAGPPRTEVLKFAMGNSRNEIWKSKQVRPKEDQYEFETSSSLYSPGEGFFQGNYVLRFYKKLPEDFIIWAMKSGHGFHIEGWVKSKKVKLSDNLLNTLFSIEPYFTLNLYDKVSSKEAKKYYEIEKKISPLLNIMSEEDLKKFLSGLDDYEPPMNYNKVVAEDLYNKLMKKSSPTEDDIMKTAGYIQKIGPMARNNSSLLPMDLINGLKNKFPEFDFRIVGGWAFWKREE